MRKIVFALLPVVLAVMAGCSPTRKTVASGQADDAVDVGYGKVAAGDLTYSVGHVKNRKEQVYQSIYDYFRDKVPGVRVEYNGQGTPSILIRGVNTVISPTTPLFIVDGVTVDDISMINPNDVVSVDVLKDSAAAVYGVQGANGVILITLKKAN